MTRVVGLVGARCWCLAPARCNRSDWEDMTGTVYSESTIARPVLFSSHGAGGEGHSAGSSRPVTLLEIHSYLCNFYQPSVEHGPY